MSDIDPKLLKIVALAKDGIGGEKENALRLVRLRCEQLGLDFDEVMQQDEVYKEYVLPMRYRSEAELRILAQVCYRFADNGDKRISVGYNRYRKAIFVTTTPSLFIETSQAAAVYLDAFRKERRRLLAAIPGAFIAKNRLYSEHPDDDGDDEPEKPDTVEDRQRRWREAQIMETMETVQVRKALGKGA